MTRITRIKILFGQFYPCDQCHPWSIPCWLRLAAGSYPWSSALRRPRMNQPCAASRADSSRSSRRANVRSEPRLYQGSFRSSGLSFTDVVAMESLDLLTLGGLPARAAGQSKSMAAHTHQTSARLSARLPWRKGLGKGGFIRRPSRLVPHGASGPLAAVRWMESSERGCGRSPSRSGGARSRALG